MKQAKVLTEKEFKRALAICESMQNGKRIRHCGLAADMDQNIDLRAI